jgi:outer membrane protein assembly factor BamE (lipoprotein component of BamABCDE complex)
VVGGAMMFSGCLVIPVDYHSKGSRQNISDKTQSLLQPGVTTKEEVFLLLGEPDYAFDDGQHIGYAWKKVKMMMFLGYGGGEVEKGYLLQIKFDSDKRVVSVVLTQAWNSDVPPNQILRPE